MTEETPAPTNDQLIKATEKMRRDREKQMYGCKAVVTIKIEVKSNGHWGGDATVQEVQDIGGRETIRAIEDALRVGQLDYRIIGEPDVGAVTWKREK